MRWLYRQYNRALRLLRRLFPSSLAISKFVQEHFLYVPERPSMVSSVYGPIYAPYYHCHAPFEGKPDFYNRDGKPLKGFFLRDAISAHLPYAGSKYFFWDHFNIGLDTHFYAHGAMLETMGHPARRYGMFTESEGIIPEQYAIFKRYPGLEKDFDAVFTYSTELLEKLPNARFFPFCASVWYANEVFEGKADKTSISELAFQDKDRDLSMICSPKRLTPMQLIRHRFAGEAKRSGKVEVFGGFDGGLRLPFKSQALRRYRFHIVVENDLRPFYFTEKVMDCFASMTVPVYLGASRIGEFFNQDGIITISQNTPMKEILKQCTEQEYLTRLPAVQDNFRRVLPYAICAPAQARPHCAVIAA